MKFWSLTLLVNTLLGAAGAHYLGVHLMVAAACLMGPVFLVNVLLIGRRYPPPSNARRPAPGPDVGLAILGPQLDQDGGNPFAWADGNHRRTTARHKRQRRT